jgi:hypothetical protein
MKEHERRVARTDETARRKTIMSFCPIIGERAKSLTTSRATRRKSNWVNDLVSVGGSPGYGFDEAFANYRWYADAFGKGL